MVDDAPPHGDDLDIREGVRKAHGFALTDANIVRAVDNTIRLADHVMRAAEMVAAAGHEPAPPPAPAPGATASTSMALVPAMPLAAPEPVLPEASQPRRLRFGHVGMAVAASAAIALGIAAIPLPLRHAEVQPSKTAITEAKPVEEAVVARATDVVPQPLAPQSEPAPAEPTPLQAAIEAAASPAASTPVAALAEAATIEASSAAAVTSGIPAQTSANPPTNPAAGPATIPGFTPRKLDADEIATLITRGQELFAVGDVASARLMLQRAAEAASPKAALALAATYDPIVLNDLGVQGVAADLALARAWYEKAKSFGSIDAPHRLELLASRR